MSTKFKTQTQQPNSPPLPPNLSRLSRLGLGLMLSPKPKPKPFSKPTPKPTPRQPDEEWYIPYNGPYEAPREPLRRVKRDSWGDPIFGEDEIPEVRQGQGQGHRVEGEEEDEETALASRELLKFYAAGEEGLGRGRFSGGEQGRNSTNRPPRDRAQSGVSGRTVSSGAVDPTRASFATNQAQTQRRSTVSSSKAPAPSYINLDATTGGVGESPAPIARPNPQARESLASGSGSGSVVGNRVSIASIFTFGVPTRRLQPPASPLKRTDSIGSGAVGRFSRKLSRSGASPSPSSHRRSSSSGSYPRQHQNYQNQHQYQHHQNQQTPPARTRKPSTIALSPVTPTEEDYYNSYYSTLISPTQGRDDSAPGTAGSLQPPTPSTGSLSSASQHPYAYSYVLPADQPEGPRTAPIPASHMQGQGQGQTEPPRLTFTAAAPHSHSQAQLHTQNQNHGHTPSHHLDNQTLYLRRPLTKPLKTSLSTPDLRSPSAPGPVLSTTHTPAPVHSHSNSASGPTTPKKPPKPPGLPKGRDRWLSAETWCDALLFPRPRFKLRHDAPPASIPGYPGSGGGSGSRGGSGRIVSPPGSPVQRGFGVDYGRGGREEGMVSRVLAHSRSLVDLGRAGPAEGFGPPPVHATPGPAPAQDLLQAQERVPEQERAPTLRPPRPKSFAQDDLALPSPVPSLARVLEEAQILSDQRRAWHTQATRSFQNARTRARSKSLTQKGRGAGEGAGAGEAPPSGFDFLAGRVLLGNQARGPVVTVTGAGTPGTSVSHGTGTGTGTSSGVSRTSHSHSGSHSLVKTLTKSSKSHSHSHSNSNSHSRTDSHSRGHSRTDSWSKSALKLAKTATCGMTGLDASAIDDGGSATGLGPGPGLDRALKRDGTKVIRLADPATATPPSLSISPTPSAAPSASASGVSDSRIGIALSTPPPPVLGAPDREEVRLRAHPYAQGGYDHEEHYYAGPHPSLTTPGQPARALDVSARHRLPPQPSSTSSSHRTPHPSSHPSPHQSPAAHPYAHPGTPELYPYPGVPEKIVREDSTVPPPAKMWAPFAPGVLREVLPGDIQYSPFMSEVGHGEEHTRDRDRDVESRNSECGYDEYSVVGVGEALGYAGRDSGVGLGPGPGPGEGGEYAGLVGGGKRSYRQPVQYDASRPSYLSQSTRSQSHQSQTRSQGSAGLSSAHTLASSPLMLPPTPPLFTRAAPAAIQGPGLGLGGDRDVLVGGEGNARGTSTSPGMSEGSSPPRSPHSFGSPDDLEGYRDLFFRPNAQRQDSFDTASGAGVGVGAGAGWDAGSGSRGRRTGSGLTSLARQLSAEFEQMALERERDLEGRDRESSVYSRESGVGPRGAFVGVRRPTDASLEFVFEETSPFDSRGGSVSPPDPSTLSAFRPSVNIPEDVEETSRASSPIDPLEDLTERYRVGIVESVSTPPATSSDRRTSHVPHFVTDSDPDAHQPQPHAHPPQSPLSPDPPTSAAAHSSLLPPSAGLTRSSYLTSSTGSRMSGLSDFPAPPRQYATHMSLLSSYFDEALAMSEARGSRSPTPGPGEGEGHGGGGFGDRRLTFGGGGDADEEIEELVKALSAQHSRSSSHS